MRITSGRAIVLGGLTVGFLDGLDAVIFFGLRGVSPVRIGQAIAAGLLGPASFQGGTGTALVGLGLHFVVATCIVTVFVLASRRLPDLAHRPFLWGPLYGIIAYLGMNYVVIPLSAASNNPKPAIVILNGVLIHIVGVGIPAALWARAGRFQPGIASSAPERASSQ